MVLMMILTIVVLMSIIIFFGFCCCCDGQEPRPILCTKVFTICSSSLVILVLAMLIVQLVYLFEMKKSIESTGCGIALIYNDFIAGVNTSTLTFMGFRKILDVLKKF